MQKITANVYVETGFPGCNVSFLVTREGIVMIDTPMVPSYATRWRDEIARYGELRYLINTEPHIDHISGNSFFGGVLIGHEGARQEILSASVERLKDLLRVSAPESLPMVDNLKFRPPSITYSQQLTLHLGLHTIKLLNLPGHTPFQTVVYVPEERVVFTSDNVVGGMPFFRQAVPYDWLDSLKRIEQLDVDILVPGHGSPCTKSRIGEMSAIIRSCIDTIAKAIDKGLSLEETQRTVTFEVYNKQSPKTEMTIKAEREGITRFYEVVKQAKKNKPE